MAQPSKHQIDTAKLACNQAAKNNNHKVRTQISFLLDLGAQELIAESTLASWHKADPLSQPSWCVYVEIDKLRPLLDKGGVAKKSKAKAPAEEAIAS